ncbi:MAG TPA: RraA family protein [Bacillota bacterium]|nr:RraA family protein [Bacillota bacterium]
MANVGFRINREIKRPDRKLIEGFRGLPVANIADCMNRITCVDSSIRPFNKAPLLGCAFTVKTTCGDNLMFHKALDMAQPGDVIVVAGGGTMERSYCGEIMVEYAKFKRLAGFIIDGCIRDFDSISKSDFPVYAKGVTPNGPFKNGPGEIGYPVSFGSQVVFPGDILVGDGDGVVIIKPEEASELIEKTMKIFRNEEKILEDIAKGNGMDRSWVDKLLKEKSCEF